MSENAETEKNNRKKMAENLETKKMGNPETKKKICGRKNASKIKYWEILAI